MIRPASEVTAAPPAPDAADGVGAAATATFIAPSSAEGDYGASLGNVRDMDCVDDIAVKPTRLSLGMSPLGGTMVRGYPPRQQYTFFPIAPFSSMTPIPTRTYHHAIYRLRVAAEGTCETNGLIAYSRVYTPTPEPIYSYPFLPHMAPLSCPFGEFCIVYTDMATNQNGSRCPTWTGSSSPTAPSPWLAGEVQGFGIVPHEYWQPGTCAPGASGGPEYYDLDYVYLTGDILARAQDKYQFTARWEINNPDGLVVTSTVRYKEVDELRLPSLRPACAEADFHPQKPTPPTGQYKVFLPITSGGAGGYESGWIDFKPLVRTTTRMKGETEQSYQLSFADDEVFTDGMSYYLCVEADNGRERTYAVSDAPVIRVPLPPFYGGCG
jgi:hypothetical protein